MNIQAKIIEVMSDVLDNVTVSESTCRQSTPEWNSLKHMEIIFAIEEEFNIQYSVEEIIEVSSVLDIANSITGKGYES